MSLKQELQTLTRQLVGSGASSIFLDKCLQTIEEAADDRRALLDASDRVGKRIALFIDQQLAKKVTDALRARLGSETESGGPPSWSYVRKHKRFTISTTVSVVCNGKRQRLETLNISLGGMFLKIADPFPRGSVLDILLPLSSGATLALKGVVVFPQDRPPQGVGVQFREMPEGDLRQLKNFLERVSADQDRH